MRGIGIQTLWARENGCMKLEREIKGFLLFPERSQIAAKGVIGWDLTSNPTYRWSDPGHCFS